jgi:uncharacterized protein YndB with AHSA1/START domain
MADRPVADGIVERAPDGSTQIRFVRRLPHPVDRVWEALTDPAELHRWWGDTDLELAEGGRFALRWRNTDPDGNAATLDGAITKLDPPRFLEISAAWGTTGSTGPGTPTTLTWELEPVGGHTVLRFTNTLPTPPEESTTAAGWHLHLDALAATLAGEAVDIARPESLFDPIHKAYEERYGREGEGPEAEVEGPGAARRRRVRRGRVRRG